MKEEKKITKIMGVVYSSSFLQLKLKIYFSFFFNLRLCLQNKEDQKYEELFCSFALNYSIEKS